MTLRRSTPPRRHLAAPLKTVPPYVSLEYSAEAVSAPMELCNVENGLQYLGIRGADSEGGCMRYTLIRLTLTLTLTL